MERYRNVLIALSLLVLASSAPAQGGPPPPPTNILYGFVTGSRTLAYAPPGPVYYVVGDLVVNSGATLTIEPGVTLAFEANRDTLAGGDYPTRSELDVKGTLIADATAGDSIRFVSTGTGTGDWGKIKVEGAATIERVVIDGADVGLDLFGSAAASSFVARRVTSGVRVESSSTGFVRDCILTGSGSGIGLDVNGGPPILPADSTDARPIVVSHFTFGVRLQLGAPRVSNILAYDNQTGVVGSANSVMSYCTAVRNTGFGISAGDSPRIYSSIVTQNGVAGIQVSSSSYINYADVWGNNQNYSGNGLGLGSQTASFDPFYVNYSASDFHLSSGSAFKTYGPWGAEIGAYGPGPGTPVKTEATTWGRVKASYR